MNSSSSRVCSILDIPDEILVKIISYFNTRKRLALANTCVRFNSLVFGDEELLRDLDFSKKGRLTAAEVIQRYFSDVKSRNLIRKVNIQNVNCVKPGKMLNNTIGKAINLVEINLHGIKFRHVEQLGSFLEPLIHVRRLSVDWPTPKGDHVKICRKILQKTLSRLKFFSVKIFVYSVEFLPTIKLCEQLEELRMVTTESRHHLRRMSWDLEPNKLRNLKIVQVRGPQAMQLKKHLVNILPDVEKWTDFQLTDISTEPGFYLEKNVEVCAELQETKLMGGVPYQRENPAYDMGWFLISEYLLKEVIEITHEDAQESFCSLTPTLAPLEQDREPCLLKIDEAKRLLKDPRYQISFLYFKHSIESDCDAHLVASAFPNLTELVLCNIIKSEDTESTSRKKKHFKRHLRRRGSIEPEKQDDIMNLDSSFRMLIENTPHLRDLTIYAQNENEGFEEWDLGALCLIPYWKNLRILRLAFVPIRDGKFLINIGKECLKLEKIVLYNLRNSYDPDCCYSSDLSQMLSHCKNLKEFSIQESCIENIPKVLFSLYNNLKIRRFSLISLEERKKFYKLEDLVSSIEELLHTCLQLTTFVFIIKSMSQEDSSTLTSALRRIKEELNRPDFQFQLTEVRSSRDGSKPNNSEIVYEDASPSFFYSKLDEFDFER